MAEKGDESPQLVSSQDAEEPNSPNKSCVSTVETCNNTDSTKDENNVETSSLEDTVMDSKNSVESLKKAGEGCDYTSKLTGGQQQEEVESFEKEDNGDESKKEKDCSGSQSTATTPASLSGQDSGISLISPDDSSCDATANNTAIKELSGLGEEMASKKQLKEGLDDNNVDGGDVTKHSIPDVNLVHDDLAPSTDAVPASISTAAGVLEIVEKIETPPSGAVAETCETMKDQESVYYIKWIMFNQTKVPIITQNGNGPCPLLAIMNVLLLNGKVKLAHMMEMVTSEQLMTYLGDCILESRPQNLSEMTQANYEQNMQDAMGIMYKLQTGLDVNVKFSGVGDFEYTPECIIFDLLEIGLYHGWLVDPQDASVVEAVGQCSYNQLVESIISLKSSQKEDEERKGLIAEQFLDGTASQLTYHGLCELSSVVKEKELCVFFRNNHFNTLYKHNNELFLLVTDQGYMTEGGVVWETLCNVEGDGHFVDAQFRTYTKPIPSTDPIPDPGVPVGSPEQIDHDYQVALSLQVQEENVQPTPSTDWPTDQDARTLADHELALRLQEQEHQSALSLQQQHQQQEQQHHPQQQQQDRQPLDPSALQQGGPPARVIAGGHQGSSGGASQQEGMRRREEAREKESKCSIL